MNEDKVSLMFLFPEKKNHSIYSLLWHKQKRMEVESNLCCLGNEIPVTIYNVWLIENSLSSWSNIEGQHPILVLFDLQQIFTLILRLISLN